MGYQGLKLGQPSYLCATPAPVPCPTVLNSSFSETPHGSVFHRILTNCTLFTSSFFLLTTVYIRTMLLFLYKISIIFRSQSVTGVKPFFFFDMDENLAYQFKTFSIPFHISKPFKKRGQIDCLLIQY